MIGSEWVREDLPDGGVKFTRELPPVENVKLDPVPENLIGISDFELEQLALKSQIDVIRQHRNQKLTECDWTQTRDCSLSKSKQEEWSMYRKELKDIPNSLRTMKDVENFKWPKDPSGKE